MKSPLAQAMKGSIPMLFVKHDYLRKGIYWDRKPLDGILPL
jgi:hypothetical protein